MTSTHHSPRYAPVSWLDWEPNPERAFREHDSTLEPFASMTKEQLRDAMIEAGSGPEWDFLQEFFLDKCSLAELAVPRLTFLRQQFGTLGDEVLCFLSGAAGVATRLASDERWESDGLDASTLEDGDTTQERGPDASSRDRWWDLN